MTQLETDLNYISSLADQPAMATAALKAEFDKAGNVIKAFINGTLEPEITSEIASCLASAKSYADTKIGQISLSGNNISYDNTESELEATNVQDAIDEIKEITEENAASILELSGSLTNWIKTQEFSLTVTQNGYTDKTTQIGTLVVPTGYTYIGIITASNTNPTKVTATYEISTSNVVYARTENYSQSNSLTTTVKCKAIYLKDNIS